MTKSSDERLTRELLRGRFDEKQARWRTDFTLEELQERLRALANVLRSPAPSREILDLLGEMADPAGNTLQVLTFRLRRGGAQNDPYRDAVIGLLVANNIKHTGRPGYARVAKQLMAPTTLEQVRQAWRRAKKNPNIRLGEIFGDDVVK